MSEFAVSGVPEVLTLQDDSASDFRTLFEVSPVAVYAIDAAGIVKHFNRIAAQLWGRTPKAGDTDEMFCGSHRLYRPDGTYMAHRDCPMATVLHGEIAEVRDAEVIIERPDGSRVSVIVNIKPLQNAVGQITGAINCFYDITERKRLERLAQQQADDLIDLHKRKDEFLAMLSHELRGPLAPIFSSIQMLQRGVADSSKQARLHAIIENQARQLKHLVDDLMDVSRITHGKIQLQLREASLAEIVERAIDTALPTIEERTHVFEMDRPLGYFPVNVDTSRMEQVVVNLLVNAAKYTPKGGTISLSLTEEAGQAVLRVKDTGVGISTSLLPKVFDLFTQAEPSIDRTSGGLGIGLSLVYRLVDLHGGVVSVTSSLGEGSEFTVRLPLALSLRNEMGSSGSAYVSDGGRRVLVVDDNNDITGCLSMFMEDLGFEVRVAHDGEAALSEAVAFRPHIVLLDIGLPKMDGYQVARAIRRNKLLAQPILIAVTGYGQDSDRYKSKDAGFDHHLVKPVDIDDVLQAFETVKLFPRVDDLTLVH